MTLDVGIADALAGALVPVRDPRAAKTRPEFYLDVVVKSGLDVSVADAITGGELERTMEGASTLTLTLHDPHRALLRNPDLARAIDMTFGGYWWRLVKVSKSGDALTLTFEDRDVAYLRQHAKPRKAFRNKVTRAEFIRQLVREVGQRPAKKGRKPTWNTKRITFVCPELTKVQPIGNAEDTKAPARRTKTARRRQTPGPKPEGEANGQGCAGDARTAPQRRTRPRRGRRTRRGTEGDVGANGSGHCRIARSAICPTGCRLHRHLAIASPPSRRRHGVVHREVGPRLLDQGVHGQGRRYRTRAPRTRDGRPRESPKKSKGPAFRTPTARWPTKPANGSMPTAARVVATRAARLAAIRHGRRRSTPFVVANPASPKIRGRRSNA
jgi:hypothetical protein